MSRAFGWITGVAAVLAFTSSAMAAGGGCGQFQEAMLRGSGDLKTEFVRPVMVSRGSASGLDSFDLVSSAKIDGVLRCQGEKFVSFEAKIVTPADDALRARFRLAQQSALVAALDWTPAHAQTKLHEMAGEAADYLRASNERGDVSIAGKVEEHEPGSVTLGMIWTQTDRTFILLKGE